MGNQVKTVDTTPVSATAVAQIESQVATAKRYPREIRKVKENIIAYCTFDEETAESCYYAVPRGGKPIEGPSIRLAEIALACYGNCLAGAEISHDDGRFIYAVGRCRDLENNTAVEVSVRRKITNKEGRRFSDDMIAVTANAACAIALRNAIFKVVPGVFVKPALEAAKKAAVGNMKSFTKRRADVIARLTKFGVDEKRICLSINKKTIEDIDGEDLATLIGFGKAIKDGEVEVEEVFPVIKKTPKPVEQKNILPEQQEEIKSLLEHNNISEIDFGVWMAETFDIMELKELPAEKVQKVTKWIIDQGKKEN